MRSTEDLEGYLNRLQRNWERAEDGTYLVALAANQPPLALRHAPPVVVAQVAVGRAPAGDGELQSKLFRRLLELNAVDLLHASYALEGEDIVLTAALELDSLDLNELEAVLGDVDLALANHTSELKSMVQQGSGA